MNGYLPKGFYEGTHRVVEPGQTFRRWSGLMPSLGITRIANITGLDVVGLPVVMVCRPNARSLSVSQGKGLTLDAAMASGLMEAIESWHAEHILSPLLLASHAELVQSRRTVAEVERLPRLAIGGYHPRRPLLWIEGTNWNTQRSTWVPFEVVHTNYTLPLPTGSGCFTMSSNGLASGNHLWEAVSHGLCEVIERDATSLWRIARSRGHLGVRLDLDTVSDDACRSVLRRFAAAEVAVGVWVTTTDIGVPAFACSIADRRLDPLRRLFSSQGMGCHPSPRVALLRGLTEAAQSRLTLISGSRDDADRERFDEIRDPAFVQAQRELLDGDAETLVPWSSVHGAEHDCIDDDVQWLCQRLREHGMHEVVVVDLSRPELGVPVVRVVVPGLEGIDEAPGFLPGPRGRGVTAS